MATGTISKNMVLLWTNPNPTSAFEPQTVSVNLSKYSIILIEFAYNTSPGNNTYYSIFANDSSRGHYTLTNLNMDGETQGGPITTCQRVVSFAQGGITFGKGLQKDPPGSGSTYPTVNNIRCIPLKIWGIR